LWRAVNWRADVKALLFAALLALCSQREALAEPWTGTDKLLHFGLSAAIGGVGYAFGVACCETRPWGLMIGGGIGLAAGAAKELLDLAGAGQPSFKAFVWDVAGVALGLGIALSIDMAVHGAGGQRWQMSGAALGPPTPGTLQDVR